MEKYNARSIRDLIRIKTDNLEAKIYQLEDFLRNVSSALCWFQKVLFPGLAQFKSFKYQINKKTK